jgi:two-component system sensor histidine kinase KdpD
LRTPLTSIRAAATTLLEATGLDEAGRLELASIVDEESSRLDRLIGEAVEMAEIDANVVEVHLVPQHPRTLLEQAVEESCAALAGRRVVIAIEEPEGQDELGKPGAPSKTERPEAREKANKPQRPNKQDKLDRPVWFDPHLLGRVLRHLLENAARHTPAGGRILLGCRRRGDRLEFRVEDDGPGVDPADLPFIFEKFYRGREGATKGKGTGMGLAITRAILAAHGGGIEVESAPLRGACFRFWVPLVEREPASTEAEKSSLR